MLTDQATTLPFHPTENQLNYMEAALEVEDCHTLSVVYHLLNVCNRDNIHHIFLQFAFQFIYEYIKIKLNLFFSILS